VVVFVEVFFLVLFLGCTAVFFVVVVRFERVCACGASVKASNNNIILIRFIPVV
jgi:hypothetical protein